VAKTKAAADEAAGGRRFGWALWLLVGITAAVGAFLFAREQARGGGEAVEPPARGLPATPDYHALLVLPDDSEHLLLGTHVGIYESRDGGASWRFLGLEGKDAMNQAHEEDGTLWAAGHEVLERSEDGGQTWRSFEPEGLPGLDIHGFAIDRRTGSFFAAVAGEGLYRSDDRGRTYEELSTEVGANVYGLAILSGGTIYAAEPGRGVLEDAEGDGAGWELQQGLDARAVGLASNGLGSGDERVLIAGSKVQLDDGRAARDVLAPADGAGPVAFAPSDPSVAYVITFDRKLHRSNDGGETWQEVR
jgi:photosystem II stability/assembly factor-like uncharacterized protein